MKKSVDNKILRGVELKEYTRQFYKKVSDDLNTEISKLGTASKADLGVEQGNVPVLDSNGKLNPSVLPSIAIDELVTVNTKAEALTANVQNGDFVRVTEDARVYMVIDDTKTEAFDEMFVPLSSVTDNITRAEVQAIADTKVDKSTYVVEKAELEANIATKVAQTEYNAKIGSLETLIDTKVSESDYEVDKADLEAKIDTKVDQTAYDIKVKELETDINSKVSTLDYTQDLVELNLAIDAKVAQADYDDKVQEIEDAIQLKADKTALEAIENDNTAKLEEVKTELTNKIDTDIATLDTKIQEQIDTLATKAELTASEDAINARLEIVDNKIISIEADVATKVDQTEYSTKVDALQADINTRLTQDAFDIEKTAIMNKVDAKASALVVENGALVLKQENGTALSSIDFITNEDIKDIIDSL